MKFFIGMHHVARARHVPRAFISVNRLWERKSGFEVGDWIMDSGAFTEVSQYGCYRTSPEAYAREVRRWRHNGRLLAAVAQDFMCEDFILEKTGATITDHQCWTIERYDALRAADPGVYTIPVLQGWTPGDYLRHLEMYGSRLPERAWVGVGSVCKRNTDPMTVWLILIAILARRPDLRLHGFGIKRSALCLSGVRESLYSSDSMAWSYAARRQGRNPNDWREAVQFFNEIEQLTA